MKKIIALLAFLAVGLVHADTDTTRLLLVKPTIGSAGWGTKVNTNYDLLDAGVGVLASTNTWTSTQTFNSSINLNGTPPADQTIYFGGVNSIQRATNGTMTLATNGAGNLILSPSSGFVGIAMTPARALDVTGSIGLTGQLITSRTASRAAVIDAAQQLSTSAVTTTELGYLSGVTSAIQTQLNATAPPGMVAMFGGASAPTGWLLCDGSSLSTTTYSGLFAVIAFTYGGSGANFTLPDFRGVFPKGAGTTNRALGKDSNGTFYTGTIGSYLTDKFQGHYHNMQNYGSDTDAIPNTNSGSPGNSQLLRGSAASISQDLKIKAAITDGANGTPRTGATTEPQSLGITFIIKT